MNYCSTESSTAWKRRRRRRKRVKNRRISAKESTRKNTTAATVQVTPPIAAAAAAARVAPIRTAEASPRAEREIRARRKDPARITAQRVTDMSRVRKRPPLTGAGRRARALHRRSLKRRVEIIDKQGQKGEGAGVEGTALRLG